MWFQICYVGGPFEGATLLLLHHVGAKSGKDRVNPLVYYGDGDRYVIFASDTFQATGGGDRRGAGQAIPGPGRALGTVRRVPGENRSGDSGDRVDTERLSRRWHAVQQ